jgi:hypothetical protein
VRARRAPTRRAGPDACAGHCRGGPDRPEGGSIQEERWSISRSADGRSAHREPAEHRGRGFLGSGCRGFLWWIHGGRAFDAPTAPGRRERTKNGHALEGLFGWLGLGWPPRCKLTWPDFSRRNGLARGFEPRAKSTSLRRTEGWAVNKASQITSRGLWRLWAWKRCVLRSCGHARLATAAPTKSATWGTTAALDKARALFSGQRGEKIRERLTDRRLRDGRVGSCLTDHACGQDN